MAKKPKKKKIFVNMALRHAAGARLIDLGVDLVHVEHELFRLHRGPIINGLTPREVEEIKTLWKDLQEIHLRLSTLHQKLHKTTKLDWGGDNWPR